MAPKFFLKYNKNIIKKILLFKIFKNIRRNIKDINTLFIKGNSRFGNYFISINNAIIYCEFLGCKKIIIEKNKNIYINKAILYKKKNITIEPNQTFNSKENNSIIFNVYFFYFNNFRFLRNLNRFYIFKKQLLNNVPKVITHPDDLYIYIRSGDIFGQFKNVIQNYYQPPLCFYIKILFKYKFREVFIISEDKLNPVIPLLLSQYSNIKFMKNNLKLDISYLINSYNIVAAKSTFFSASIKLNGKLKFLWEYDFYSTKSKSYLNFHYSFYKFHIYYTIYKMYSSINYKKIMMPWINSPRQRKRMIEEKCMNNFDIIRQ